MSALAQNRRDLGQLFGITPLPVNPRRRTTTAPPPVALSVLPAALPNPTPRPTPATPRPTPTPHTQASNGAADAKGMITVGPNLPCADCDPGNGQGPTNDPNYATARVRPYNKTGGSGVNLGSRNFNWAANLISLPGRAGMDFNLSLAYNSLLWTRSGNYIRFNADMGTPAPGFQMGLPKLEVPYINGDTGLAALFLVMPDGRRVELRWKQNTATGADYEAEDGSFLKVSYSGSNNGNAVMSAPGGFTYHFQNWRCRRITDRNGNMINIEHDADGHITAMHDTLNHHFYFNYSHAHSNPEHNLVSITQDPYTANYTWATFEYGTVQLGYNFSGLQVNAPANGSSLTVLQRVNFADGSSVRFDYTPYGQVWRIANYAANGTTLLSRTSYNVNPGSGVQTDCPRFTERRDWAREANGDVDGVPGLPNDPTAEDTVTTYSVDPATNANQPAWSQVTAPDGVTYKENYYTSGAQLGLTSKSEVIVNNVVKKWVNYTWEQLSSAGYAVNPRLKEVTLSDDTSGDGLADNQRRTKIIYDTMNNNPYNLPAQVEEYQADGATVARRTETQYEWDPAYLDRNLIGLVKHRAVYGTKSGANGLVLLAKTSYEYDWDVIDGEDYLTGYPSNYEVINHDTIFYGTSLVVGRGNLTSTIRWDVTAPTDDQKAVGVRQGYDLAGSVRFTRDALGRKTVLDYADRGPNGYLPVGNGAITTMAFVTSVTDPEQALLPAAQQQKSYLGYDYGKSLLLKTEGLKPQNQTQGRIQTYSYDALDRLERVTTVNNGAYTRWEYPGNGVESLSYSTVDNATEVETRQVTDGAGRVIRSRTSHHNGVASQYRAQRLVYDVMGRTHRQMYPLQVDANWTPAGDDAGKQWNGPAQLYDWQGRPTTTTNVDGTQRVIEYLGCGCAGQDVTTVRDESGRRRKYYKDIAGRLVKVEELNWNPQTVYATTTYEYNGRDQIERILQNGSRERKFEYDGHGRLEKRTTPEQGLTEFAYNRDDSVNWTKDARLVKTTFGYYPRGLVANITYDLSAASGVAAVPNVSFDYDLAGNRKIMVEAGQGTVTYAYDQLSRLTSEVRGIDGVGSYTFNYTYNLAGQLKTLQNPFGATTNYNYDVAGQVTSVTGSGTMAPPTAGNKYIDNIAYRAFGGLKQVNYGNGRTLSLSYTNRLFLDKWDLPNNGSGGNTSQTALGYQYDYNKYGENYTGRPDFAQSLYDNTLDRAWTYDQVGRLIRAYTGTEAHAQWSNNPTGPYAQGFDYDPYGNITQRFGWGGENPNYAAVYTDKNQNAAWQYDAAGNLLNDGGQSYTYDAQGQQRSASFGLSEMLYDGDGVRLKKVENGATTYYLRSTVLGQQVACELQRDESNAWAWTRGYVYLGGQLLATQDVASNKVLWVHQEPYSKGQRLTNASGAIETSIEVDPFGGQVFGSQWSWNGGTQPKKYTTYERDGNGGDEAMFRRYERWHNRFYQPDPYDGSMSLTDPQSLNRYAYTQNDPINYVDPQGLFRAGQNTQYGGDGLGSNGFFSPGIHSIHFNLGGIGGVRVDIGLERPILVLNATLYWFVSGVSSSGRHDGDDETIYVETWDLKWDFKKDFLQRIREEELSRNLIRIQQQVEREEREKALDECLNLTARRYGREMTAYNRDTFFGSPTRFIGASTAIGGLEVAREGIKAGQPALAAFKAGASSMRGSSVRSAKLVIAAWSIGQFLIIEPRTRALANNCRRMYGFPTIGSLGTF